MAAAAGERGEGAEAAEPGAGLAVTALHFECIATRRLDFRELSLLAQLCKAARQAVAQGPLHIMTDVTRVLSHADLDHVLHLLRWCGGVVHVLRLHQQSRALWAPPGIMDDDERRMSRMAAMERMPFPQTSILEKVRQRCPNLQELLIDGWMAYCGTDPHWDAGVISTCSKLPHLRRIHMPMSDNVTNRRLDVLGMLESCPELTQLSLHVPFPLNTRPLLLSAQAGRLQQLALHCVGREEVSMLRAACPNLRRLDLQDCGLGGLVLTEALPGSLTCLHFLNCEGPLGQATAEQMRSRFANLQSLQFDWVRHKQPALLSSKPEHIQMLASACMLASLRFLDVRDQPFDDAMLTLLATHSKLLHTLLVPETKVSAAGFATLRQDVQLMPRLRVIEYRNEVYAENLDHFYSMSLEEREQELQQELREISMLFTDDVVELANQVQLCRDFFEFASLVVARGLIVPLQAQSHCVLPWQRHELCQDPLALGSRV